MPLITIALEREDFHKGECLPDVLARLFGLTEPLAVTGSPSSPDIYAEVVTHTTAQETQGGIPLAGVDTEWPEQTDAPEDFPEPAARGTPAPTNAGPLDADGVPWTAELHSSGKTQYKSGPNKGCWIKRKGLAEEEFAARTAELKALHSNKVVMAGADTDTGSAAAASQPPLAGAAPASAPTGAGEAASSWTIPIFLQKVTQAQNEGRLTKERLAQVLASYEIPALPMLAAPAHKSKLGSVIAELGLA